MPLIPHAIRIVPRAGERDRRALGPRVTPAHEARILEYRRRIERGEGIFGPQTAERPVSSLYEELTASQIVTFAERRRGA